MKFIIVLFLLISSFGHSQNHIKHYTIVNGLPHDVTYGIFQDSKGYIWIGTDNGLAKFNGQDFKNFTIDDGLRSNFVIDITEDENQNIILGTWGGGINFIKNDKVILPKVKNDSIDKIHSVFYYKGNIISPVFSGNLFYNKQDDFRFNKQIMISDIKNSKMLEAKQNEVSKGYTSVLDSILVLSNKTMINPNHSLFKGIYEVSDDFELKLIFPFLQNKVINSIDKISHDRYIASVKDSIFIFDKQRIIKKVKLSINNPYIVKIIETKQGGFLLLTSDTNAFKNAHLFSSDFESIINFKPFLKLKSTISNILEDHEGNIWISTYGDGLFCVIRKTSNIKNFDNDLLRESLVNSIAELDSSIYVLTPNYLTKIKGSKVEEVKLKGFGKNIIKKNESLIISSLVEENFSNYKHLKHNLAYKNFLVDSVGLIYYADSLKISKYKASIMVDKMSLYDATFYKDTLWFATNIGAFYYKKNAKRLIRKDISSKKLLGSHINKFLKVDQTLWIATNKGLSKIENNEINHFTKTEGLINNSVNTLCLDHRKNIWIGTQQGISLYNNDFFINISQQRALKSPFVNVIFEDSKHTMWIGGDKGIALIDNSKTLKLKSAPIINIKQDDAVFNYDVISYNRSNDLLNEHKINDSDWIKLTNTNGTLDFSNYQKGNYKLQFRTKKQDGIWGYSKIHKFEIKEIWYKSWYFSSLLILIISSCIILAVFYLLQKARKNNRTLKRAFETQIRLEKELTDVRDEIAQDFHDDLGNKLARIALLSNLVSSEPSINNPKIKSKIKQITEDADDLYRGTRDFVFSLKSNSDYLEEVVTYLSDFGEDYFSKSKIKFMVKRQIKSNVKLPHYWNKQLIFIFKEALTNTLKYSECNTVNLAFIYKNDTLEISCIDNGKGITETNLESSNGLSNMKQRAGKIGGKLIINSNINKGTTITFIGKMN